LSKTKISKLREPKFKIPLSPILKEGCLPIEFIHFINKELVGNGLENSRKIILSRFLRRRIDFWVFP